MATAPSLGVTLLALLLLLGVLLLLFVLVLGLGGRCKLTPTFACRSTRRIASIQSSRSSLLSASHSMMRVLLLLLLLLSVVWMAKHKWSAK